MKVVLSYACDLEDVPENVAELLMNLNKQFTEVETLLKTASYASRNVKITAAMEQIDDLRKLLAKIDSRLRDYSSILGGYAKTDVDIKMGINPVADKLEKGDDESSETND